MEPNIPQESEPNFGEKGICAEEPHMAAWLAWAFRGTRLTRTVIVDELRAELPPSLFYWRGIRSGVLPMYRDDALCHAKAEYAATLRGGGEVHLSVVFRDVDKPSVVMKDADRLSLQIPYDLATIFAMAVIRELAPYGVWMTTREETP